MNKTFCYFLVGVNVVRIPDSDYKEGVLDEDNVEVLMWTSKTEYRFEKNELSRYIAEENEILRFEKHDSEIELLVELGKIESKELTQKKNEFYKWFLEREMESTGYRYVGTMFTPSINRANLWKALNKSFSNSDEFDMSVVDMNNLMGKQTESISFGPSKKRTHIPVAGSKGK